MHPVALLMHLVIVGVALTLIVYIGLIAPPLVEDRGQVFERKIYSVLAVIGVAEVVGVLSHVAVHRLFGERTVFDAVRRVGVVYLVLLGVAGLIAGVLMRSLR